MNKGKFSSWTIIPALQKNHFNVMIREINLGDVKMDKDKCFCGSGKSHSECHADIADNTAMSYLYETFKLIDDDIRNKVPPLFCKKNCAECCEYSFEVSAAELFAILRYIQKSFTKFNIAALKKNAIKKLPKFPSISDTSNQIGRKFAPCIFLDNRKMCRIYEVRPIICRMYGYFFPAGICPDIERGIEFISPEIETHISKFISDTLIQDTFTGELVFKPPIAVPMVYWFGSKVLQNVDVKHLYMVANEKSINDYVEFSIHSDFNDWF